MRDLSPHNNKRPIVSRPSGCISMPQAWRCSRTESDATQASASFAAGAAKVLRTPASWLVPCEGVSVC